MRILLAKISFKRKTSLLFRYTFDAFFGFGICLIVQLIFEMMGWSNSKTFTDFFGQTLLTAIPMVILAWLVDVLSDSSDD
ncbi:hypothetical protein ACFQ22_08440 [Lentilactobacillus raoultii]|uniref:Uncharacterized protein n=1 Tax=Lentilactobacillus raoultii TaxID=1987503 RepID=A0ABW3PIA5_9LACO|nr:hypothetical protein [Lentilactobacillus raoultii]